MILTAKHVTIPWDISPLCTFKPFISHNLIYRNLLYKDVTQSDRVQRCDVTESSEVFSCFRNVFGKFKIYTFQTLINKLLLTKKFRKTFCKQKWLPNFIFSSQKNVQIHNCASGSKSGEMFLPPASRGENVHTARFNEQNVHTARNFTARG